MPKNVADVHAIRRLIGEPAQLYGDPDEAWPIVNLNLDGPADHDAALPVPRYELHWSGGRPIAGILIDRNGRRPHPDSPREAEPLLASRADQCPPADSAQSAISEESSTQTLTLIIPTRDRPEDLSRCLKSLAVQSAPPDQVLVVDNASASRSVAAIARSAGAEVIREERAGLNYARNAGILASRGDIVAFCDDDVVLHHEWCAQMRLAFDNHLVDAVTGLVLPMELHTVSQRVFELNWGFGRGFRRIDYGPAFFRMTVAHGCPAWIVGAGASMAFRRSIFDRVGLFDERLDAGAAGCSGDSEMWYRILALGGMCRYEPRVVSFHRHRRTPKSVEAQIRSYMRGHVAALLIQYQRFGHQGNLTRAFLTLPKFYIQRFARRFMRGGDCYLHAEVAGFIQGFLYFARYPFASRSQYPPHRSTQGRGK